MAKPKSKLKRSAFSFAGYEVPKIVEQSKDKVEKTFKKTFLQKLFPWTAPKTPIVKPKYNIYCGPLKEGDKKLVDLIAELQPQELDSEQRKIIEDKYMPNPQLTVYDHQEKKALTAVEADDKRKSSNRWMPIYYQNPLQSYDYIVYESLIKNSVLGPVMSTLIKFIMGTGFRPELELRMPTNDEKADAKLITENEKIISNLLLVDRVVTERSSQGGIDISFKTKMTNMINNMLIFNRSCGVFVYDTKDPIRIDGKEYPDIPINIVDFHPRDMGMVKISPDTHKMEALQINQIPGFTKTDEMIYLWNSEYAAPIWNAKYYGGSIMMPVIDPARLIRSQISSILPAISENMAGGLYHIFVEPQGGTEDQKRTEYESITTSAEFGTSNVFMISPDRVQYENVNFDPKIAELIQMFEMLVKYILASANVPQVGFFDEAAANHATAVEKIQLTISTVINPRREWIGDEIAKQWYNKIFEILYKDDKKILEQFRIKVVFDDLQVETLKERAEGLEILERRAPLTHEKAAEILQIDGYEDNIDEEREPVPPREQFEVKSGDETFNVKT